MTVAVKPAADPKTLGVVDDLVRRARAAMAAFADADQARVDEAVTALAWSLYNPAHAKELAELAVKDTQLGNVPDKIIKKQRKTFGTLRDLLRVKSVGVIEEDKARGIVKYAKPVGVVCAITPSTNPGATPVNKAMMAIKGRNAVIIAASPAGLKTTTKTVDYMRAELKKIGVPELYPMVRGRLVAVNGRPVSEADYEEERAKRLVEREFNLSYMSELPSHNQLSAGRWLDPNGRELSVEQGIAERLGWRLGDELT